MTPVCSLVPDNSTNNTYTFLKECTSYNKYKSEFMFFLSELAFPPMYINSANGNMIHLVDWVWNTGFIWLVPHISCPFTDSDIAPTVFPSQLSYILLFFLLSNLSHSSVQKHGIFS